MNVATNPEYWGSDTTPKQAVAGAQALQCVLQYAASRLGIIEKIGMSPDGDPSKNELLNAISEDVWQDDEIQAAAFEGALISPSAILSRFNARCRARGGTGHPALP